MEVALRDGSAPAVDTFLKRGARLRSLTWKVAAEHSPRQLVALIRKLIDDGRTLFRRNSVEDAMHRFTHALDKCTEFMSSDNAALGGTEAERSAVRDQLRVCKYELLYAVADIRRQQGRLREAAQLAEQALPLASPEAAFQLQQFRVGLLLDGERRAETAEPAAQSPAQSALCPGPAEPDSRPSPAGAQE